MSLTPFGCGITPSRSLMASSLGPNVRCVALTIRQVVWSSFVLHFGVTVLLTPEGCSIVTPRPLMASSLGSNVLCWPYGK